ncbi:hypothetical protein [Streptomyces sp. RKAG293]|uniref:hypothetical protein n=1 Tax=Streptomyces sp. RKAG293 TaxID=2893403 RepID=UPI002033B9C3|nr:hypothetical protein [Streptomyces sp. RKAG293]MCM2424046.1 hypothetical protein [Streptomyces sp. RKAG293]
MLHLVLVAAVGGWLLVVLLLFGIVIAPAVWSKFPARRRQALRVMQELRHWLPCLLPNLPGWLRRR